MKQTFRLSGLRWFLALAAIGLVAAGCSKRSETGQFIYRVDEALTAKAPSKTSAVNRYPAYPTAHCQEWKRFMSRKETNQRYWKFGCLNAATLAVSVSDKRDLTRGRSLRPSEGWEAVRTMTLDRGGKLDPGQVDTSKSATTSSSK